jgi:hypothetical protein
MAGPLVAGVLNPHHHHHDRSHSHSQGSDMSLAHLASTLACLVQRLQLTCTC